LPIVDFSILHWSSSTVNVAVVIDASTPKPSALRGSRVFIGTTDHTFAILSGKPRGPETVHRQLDGSLRNADEECVTPTFRKDTPSMRSNAWQPETSPKEGSKLAPLLTPGLLELSTKVG